MSDAAPIPPHFVYALRRATEAAARAARARLADDGRGRVDVAAARAMRDELDTLPIDGRVVIGGDSEVADMVLCPGERLGSADEPRMDVAVDPVEGTGFLREGMTNALAVVAIAPAGSIRPPGPAFYMEKFAGPPAVRGRIDPAAPVAEKLRGLAEALGKPVSELVVFVLEKTRHRGLIEAIERAGASVALYPAGDVAGALMAAIPGSGIDALMGTGGAPEGVLSACAIRAMGGTFLARLDPQLPSEQRAVREAGLNTAAWVTADDLVGSDEVYFCATGITSGLLLDGFARTTDQETTQTLIISGPARERQLLTTCHAR